ncbi:MAG: septal ring lytic transglycosylase RlpA family protein [Bacteroidales bacterium]|nr:septal ring lytic transglycosylase RlpA family protein [Bacteroidales bacterium]
MFLTAVLMSISQRLSAQAVSSTDTTAKYTMRGTYYSDKFVGRKTSSGEIFTQDRYTAAHRTLKFGTLLLITNPKNGKQVIVKVNDRCPKGNIIDLTRKAARQIGVTSHQVTVEILPSRCYALWEHQDQIVDVLEKGAFRDYLSLLDSESKLDAGKQYDLELFTCRNRDEARKRVERLPIFYQDQVEYHQRGISGRTVAILELTTTYIKAELIKKELSALFPEVKIVESK